MIIHLAVSSVILILALLVTGFSPRLTARTRHTILIAAMASLLLPSTFIARLIERSGTKVMMPVRLAMPAVVNAPAAPTAPSQIPWITIAVTVWLGVAALLFLRTFLLTHRLVSHVTRIGTTPPARTVEALASARERLSLHQSIDLVASPLCEAPAVLRIVRPLIVLPSDGCQSLGDDELESLLCHECAHVARRDNLVGLLEAFAGSVFWFHPLVWLTRKRIASAREEACDERVADAAMPAETYVGALAKLCRSLVAPRVPAVSCMANAHIKERIEHLMRYDSLRTSALSHRLMTALSTVAVVTLIFAGGVLAAAPNVASESAPYQLNFGTIRPDETTLVFMVDVVDKSTGKSVGQPTIRTKVGEHASAQFGRAGTTGEMNWHIDVETGFDGTGTITLIASEDGREIQRSTEKIFPAGVQATTAQRSYVGKPISLDLASADIRDVIRTFGDLTGLEMIMGPEVQGTVTVHYVGVPWDEALDQLLRSNGYTFKLDGKKLTVIRIGS